jgi:hypothetical protein
MFCGCERGTLSLATRKFKTEEGPTERMRTQATCPRKLSLRLKNMKMLKRLFRLLRRRRVETDRKPSNLPPSMVDADEFARLIGSGRVEDLRILARKLSTQSSAHA